MIRNFTKDEIAEMREEFIELLRKIERPNANIEGLINKLDESDFFYAPASTKYHNSCYGGLVAHSLNVYHNMVNIAIMKGFSEVIPEESVIICALLHDLSKMNFYEPTARNKKVYSPDGSKYDELGNFDWVSEMGWAVRPWKDRLAFGSHEENSEFMVRCYIPLNIAESAAIINHHGCISNPSMSNTVSEIFHRFPVAMLLHTADMMATFIDEDAP